jgi:hypothetical protein
MDINELRDELSRLANLMEGAVDDVHVVSTNTQERIYELLLRRLLELDYIEGRLNPQQPIAQKIARITAEMNAILGDVYAPRIADYLGTYQTVEDRNIAMQLGYNELVIKKSLLTPARKSIYDQAEYYLMDGLADAYVQPAKYLLLQSVTNGISLKQAKSLLNNWNEGNLATGGNLTSGRPTPRLQTYATQIARDSLYSYSGAVNEIIADKYELKRFIYQGGLVKDSRAFCKHLVSLDRKIEFSEVPKLIEKVAKSEGKPLPSGMIPGTTQKNFVVRRGGYSCQHLAFAVR